LDEKTTQVGKFFTLPNDANNHNTTDNNDNFLKYITAEIEKTTPNIGVVPVPNANIGTNAGGKTMLGAKYGSLPNPAPLATGWVPWQESADTRYAPSEGLSRGTLFPGLDLPFKNIVNTGSPYAGTPLGELLAISFAAHELVLYLDTHTNDTQAFAVLKELLALKQEAHRRYTAKYGPVTTADLINETSFTWTRTPFPWNFEEGGR
jgi:spore coat protein JB